MNNERVIRFSDLFWYILSKWKLLILAAVIGALLFGGYKAVSSGRRSFGEASQQAGGTSFDSLKSYDRTAVELFFRYLALAEKQQDYIRNAEFMQIDPYHANVGSMSFCIQCENEEDCDAVLEAYASVLEEMKLQYGGLLTSSVQKGFGNIYPSRDRESVSVIQQTGGKNALIMVKVHGADEASCRERLGEISERITEASKQISGQVYPHTVLQVGEYSTAVVSDPELVQLQTNATETLYQMISNLNSIQKSFSNEATNYVNKLTEQGKIPDLDSLSADAGEAGAKESTPASAASPKKSAKALIKSAVLGGAVLLIGMIILLCIWYFISGKLRFEDDINALFGISGLGIAADPSKKQKTGLDKKIEEKRYRNKGLAKDPVPVLAANVALAMKNAQADTLYATGTVFSEPEKKLAEELKEMLAARNITLKVGEPFMANAGAVEEMGKAPKTVFIERASVSARADLAAKLGFCRENGIGILGMILLA